MNYAADNSQPANMKIISVKQLLRNTILTEDVADDIYLSCEVSDDYRIKKYDTIIARSASPGEAALSLDDLDVLIYTEY